MRCDIDPDEVSARQPDDDEGVEHVEANGWGNEQVHGGDVRCVVTQEGAPSLGRRSTSLDHVLRHARLSDVEAEFEQLAMNARRTPQRIFRAHPPDQCAQICGDLWPASKRAGFPTPVPAKAGPMPTQQGLGPDNFFKGRTGSLVRSLYRISRNSLVHSRRNSLLRSRRNS